MWSCFGFSTGTAPASTPVRGSARGAVADSKFITTTPTPRILKRIATFG
jgi:hypothetical protein